MNNWSFFREAIRNFRSTGAIARASPLLIKRLIESVPSRVPLTVIELGPGDGCITSALLGRLHSESSLTAFEINPAFVQRLGCLADPRLRVLPVGAELLTDHFSPGSVDFVVSSLPLSMIPQVTKEEIIRQAQVVLRPEGHFLQYQYALQDYGLLKDSFDKVSVGFTLANLPPAFVYSCSLGLV
ncbi:Ornithine lipid N-methyltransferase [Neolewinella maritima]|uniref:Ornithine lipid N-methyltransferase n=1 Tax=Neolewinella maritima TaxID=1383882 RepID=A0ABM9AWT9_9BACT|nr:methyltransferase domain-containing protein [Neolewinella maritima]CAH0998946.1 Ornithine lipid N-methyltransferase [Neolewinella maritima]